MFRFQSPIQNRTGELRRHGTVTPNMLPSPEARPHGLLKSNHSRSAAGSVGGVLSHWSRPTLAHLILELVSLAGASRGSRSIRDGQARDSRLVRCDAEVTTSPLLSSHVAGENREAQKPMRGGDLRPGLHLGASFFSHGLNEALPPTAT